MSLPLENLDDKTYAELVRDALARIPIYAPRWTDRNESDPGVTFIELFAWLADMQIYSLNRIDDSTRLKCLRLLGDPRPFPANPAETYLTFNYTPSPGLDYAFYNSTVLDLSRDSSGKMHFYPLGTYPSPGDTFYLSKRIELSKAGGTIRLDFTLQDPKPTSIYTTAIMGWQYFNGSNWADLPIKSYSSSYALNLRDSGYIIFICPTDIKECVVNGVRDYWIKVTQTSGTYKGCLLIINDINVSLNGFTIPSGTWVTAGGLGADDQIYFEIVEDAVLTKVGSSGEYVGIAYAVQGKTVTKPIDSDNEPKLGSSDLNIKLCDRIVLQNYIMQVKVKGETWGWVDDISKTSSTDKSYEADMKNRYILFGDGTNGVIPPNKATIDIYYRASAGFITRHIVSNGSAQMEIDLTDQAEDLYLDSSHLSVKIDGDTWTLASSFTGKGPTDKCYVVDTLRAIIKFGDGSQGMIPLTGASMTISYSSKRGSITRNLISPGKANFRLTLLDGPEMLSMGDQMNVQVQDLRVKVAGETWKWVNDLSTAAPTDKSYKADLKNGLITFGSGTHGMVPPSGNEILVYYGGTIGYVTRRLTSTGAISLQVSLKNKATDLYLDSQNLTVLVDKETWTAVSSFTGKKPTDKCYVVDRTHGTIRFGDGSQGMIPSSGASLSISYNSKLGLISRDVISAGEASFTINLLDVPQRDDIPWLYKEDLYASKYNDKHFTADPDKGLLIFGNGNPANHKGHGRVPISSSIITATFREGVGVEGNIRADMIHPIGDDEDHQSLIGLTVTNLTSARKGNDATTLNDAIDNARTELKTVTRCITASDYETLTMMCPRVKLARVKALPLFHPVLGSSVFNLVSVVIVPESDVMPPIASETDLTRIRRYLEQFRTIGTNLYILQPNFIRVKIKAEVVRDYRYSSDDVELDVQKALHSFLNPLTGGPDEDGWPFGRYVYQSEIMQVIDNVTGVDHVVTAQIQSWSEENNEWEFAGDPDGNGPLVIEAHELVYSQDVSDHVVDATGIVT